MIFIIFIVLNIILHDIKAASFEMLILHNNDMHGRFEETKESIDGKPVGGFGRTSTIIKEARKLSDSGKGPPVLYLNAGDTFTGTIWFSVHRWKIAATFLNELKPDVACLGNHEFDDGVPGLNPFIQAVNFPILAANLKFGNETILAENVKPSIVLNIHEKKIGIIGYLTPETQIMTTVKGIIFEDEVVALRRECEKLKKSGVNIIIALGHSGYKTDMKIAKEVKDVDLVVGGHTNTFLWNGDPPDKEIPNDVYPKVIKQESGKIVPVVQAYAYTKYIGKLHVVFDEEDGLKKFKGQPIFLNEEIPQDEQILELLKDFEPAVANYNHHIIGKTRTYLNGDSCRYKECNFGNVLADSFVDYVASMYRGPYWTNAPIAILNSGSIRSSINASDSDQNVTAGDLLGAIPFNQQLVTFDLLGRDLIETLELGARSNGETSRGEFLQVAGLKIVFDYTKPPGSRVASVKTRCGQCHVPIYSFIIANAFYRVVSTHFLLSGGDGHIVIRDKSRRIVTEEIFDAQSIQRYFEFYKILTPEEEERITIINRPTEKSQASLIKYNLINMLCSVIVYLLYCNIQR